MRLVIVGIGGVGRQVADIVSAMAEHSEATWELVGYVDNKWPDTPPEVCGVPVLGPVDWLAGHSVAVAVAIGSSAARWRVLRRVRDMGCDLLPTLIHPAATIGVRVTLGEGSLIYPGAVIDPDVCLGSGVLVNKCATVGHDALIGECVTLSPGTNIGGATRIGTGCEFGIGSAAIQGLCVGEWTVVGAGAVVIKDLPSNVTAVGVPARVIKEREPGWQME